MLHTLRKALPFGSLSALVLSSPQPQEDGQRDVLDKIGAEEYSAMPYPLICSPSIAYKILCRWGQTKPH